MDCQKCSNWKCGPITYQEYAQRWNDTIGGIITPGILKRFTKKSITQEEPLDTVTIGYKYCAKGVLSRFYLMRTETDTKASIKLPNCPKYSEDHNSGVEVDSVSPIWKVCISETHGISEVKGVRFAPALYEQDNYMRVPLYGSVRPVVHRNDNQCSSCGKVAKRAITVRIEKTFCSNKHYLEWWGKRYREEYKRLEE